mmetsp:Transcript_32810/g.71979  ORF Transcript_32810/g.71979 Transcript_32810/m.71979 type:complete len:502 (-) Transcript_32810:2904-4409(-)
MATEDRTSDFLSVAQGLEAAGIGAGAGAGADQSGGGGSAQPPYPISRAPTGIHDNTSSGSGGAASAAASVATAAAGGKMTGRYGGAGSTQTDPSDPTNELRNFHNTASEISRDIAATSAMLQELASLVRRRNLFVDDTDRVNWLVLRIKTSIQSLDGRLDEASAVIQKSKRRLGRNSQRGEEVYNLGETLKEEYEQIGMGFKSLLEERSARMKDNEDRKKGVIGSGDGGDSASAGGGGEVVLGSRPMVYDSGPATRDGSPDDGDGLPGGSALGGANSFLAANGAAGGPGAGPRLDLTSAVMMGKRGGNGSEGGMSAGEPSGSSSSYLPRPGGLLSEGGGSSYSTPTTDGMRLRHSTSEPMAEYSGGSSSVYGGYSEHGTNSSQPLTPLEIMRQESESGQEQMMQLIPDQSYLRERADVMETVESHMLELGNIFNKLAVMVNEHRDMVQRVEDNVDDAHDNINLSLTQLTDTLENLRTNRALALKVFAVVVIFIILFITFFA